MIPHFRGKNQKLLLMEQVIKIFAPFGKVLEVGFGKGEAAHFIKNHGITQHTVLEGDKKQIKLAKKWILESSKNRLIEESWESGLKKLGEFDAIFIHQGQKVEEEGLLTTEVAQAAVKKGKELVHKIEKKFPELTTICYSDEDINEFYEKVGRFNLKELPRFLSELRDNGQITKEQYEKMTHKYQVEKKEEKPLPIKKEKKEDPFFTLVEECVERHMHHKARLCCVITGQLSKYENPLFFEKIITSPLINYQEKTIEVKGKKEEILLIEKLA